MKKKQIRIEHNWKILNLIVVLLVLLIFVLVLIKKNEGNANENIECKTDYDCVKQQTSCCPCSMGGEEVCMSRQNSSIMKKKLEYCKSANVICLAVYNCKEFSCSCVKGKCVEK